MPDAEAPPSALLSEEQLTDFEHDCETGIGVEIADVVKLLAHIRELQQQLATKDKLIQIQQNESDSDLANLSKALEQVHQLQQRLKIALDLPQ